MERNLWSLLTMIQAVEVLAGNVFRVMDSILPIGGQAVSCGSRTWARAEISRYHNYYLLLLLLLRQGHKLLVVLGRDSRRT